MTTRTLRALGPLRVRLPAVMAVLLALCTGAMLAVSYRVVRSTVVGSTLVRMHAAADRVSGMLSSPVPRTRADLQRIGAVPALSAWLRGGAATRDVIAAADSVRASSAPHGVLLLIRRDGARLVSGAAELSNQPPSTYATPIGPFFVVRDSVRYTLSHTFTEDADTLGQVRVTKTLGPNQSSEILAGFVGRTGSVLIGNDNGSLWTDFSHRVPSPITAAELARARKSKDEIRGDTIAALSPIRGTPWIVWVGQSAGPALAPAVEFVKRLAWLALLVVVFGAIAAWIAVGRLTNPLNELVSASEALSAGDYTRRSSSAKRDDEVGRLAATFNTMAEHIETHSNRLEEQVRERTAELEQAQGELVRRERLATLGQLAGGVGHELRNPLGVMTNAVYVLEACVNSPDPMVAEYIGILRGQIALSEKIVADLLDFARVKPAALAPTPLDALVSRQIERLGPTSGIAVACDVPRSLPPVSIDSTQIGQVVFNLLTNAVQAMNGRIGAVRCVGRQGTDGSILLDVEDDGPGMPPDVAGRVFEPLFTTKARGLGLGLAVSRMLVENNAGELTFTTEVGRGTTFRLRLPVVA